MKTKNLIAGFVISTLVAGVASGATLRYRQSGDWTAITDGSTPGWGPNAGGAGTALPGPADDARINFANNTVTVTSNVGQVDRLQIGVDESGIVEVNSGGILSTVRDVFAGNNNPAATGTLNVNNGGFVNVGNILYVANNSSTGFLNINAGGIVDVANHLWWGTTGTATISITGTLNQTGGILGLGTNNASTATGGTAMVNILSGGVMNLNNISGNAGLPSIQAGSVLNIDGTGVLTVKGDRIGSMNDYITAGKITGTGALGVSYDGVSDLTSVMVIPEPGTFSLLGMMGVLGLLRRRRLR